MLGIVVAALHHRLRGRNEFERGAKVAASAFVALVLIPALKYPPNPPAVGDPDTIGQRSTEVLLLMMASVVVVGGAGWYRGRPARRAGLAGAPAASSPAGAGSWLMVTLLMVVCGRPAPDRDQPARQAEAAPALEGLGFRAGPRCSAACSGDGPGDR